MKLTLFVTLSLTTLTLAGPDSSHVKRATEKLDEMEKLLQKGAWQQYTIASTNFQSQSVIEKSYANEPKGPALQQRADALDAQAYKTVGGHLSALGDGKRVTAGVNPDALSAAADMLAACDAAAKATEYHDEGKQKSTLAEYEKQIARVQKLDAKAFHFIGELVPHRGTRDVPNQLLLCESKLASAAADQLETYVAEAPAAQAAIEVGCGEIDWLADGVSLGGGKFAPYERTEGGNSFVEKVACSKIPAHDNVSKPLANAAAQFRQHIENKDMVIVLDGNPYVEVNDQDFHTYRYQKLRAYSKSFKLSANPCGEKDVFCEAGGSHTAEAFNKLEFALERAKANVGTKPDMCKAQLKWAQDLVKAFNTDHDNLVKSKKWIAGATYRTKAGKKLKEKEFLAAFDSDSKLVDERIDSGYCTKK
ncbi:MAG: hypothetical protein QM831_11450 [Kofleriaceae bacterium]